jgi:hypothetical protein
MSYQLCQKQMITIQAGLDISVRPYLKKYLKQGWRSGSSGRAPA